MRTPPLFLSSQHFFVSRMPFLKLRDDSFVVALLKGPLNRFQFKLLAVSANGAGALWIINLLGLSLSPACHKKIKAEAANFLYGKLMNMASLYRFVILIVSRL